MDIRPALKTGGSLALGVLALGAVQSGLTLAMTAGGDFGVRLSARTPGRVPDALDQTMPLLASASSGSAPSGSFP